jgi:hypothetical protein
MKAAPSLHGRRLTMEPRLGWTATTLLLVLLLVPGLVEAAGVVALFDLSHRRRGPFPSDHFTVPDNSQNTGLRVTLPKPD